MQTSWNLCALLAGTVNWCSYCNHMVVPQKIKNRIIFNPAIPFLELWTKETKTITREDVCTPMFMAALLIVNKIGKQVSSMNEWIKNSHIHTHTHTHNGISFNHKNKKILQFVATLMDPEDIKLSEISDRKRKILCDFTYIWNLI